MRLSYSNNLTPGVPTATVLPALGAISESQLRQWVEKISLPRHFKTQLNINQAMACWLAEQLGEWGYDVRPQGRFHNVVAWPRVKAAEVILVGAHYDSVPETPGADDNGSAVAALLGCAEVVAKVMPGAPVGFVAFNCEEDGMWGSGEFVGELAKTGVRVREAHILEMVGFASSQPGSQRLPTGLPIKIPDRGDFLGLLANQNSGPLMDSILGQARTYLPEFSVIGLEVPVGAEMVLPVLARSDHVPFWDANIPAVMWTDTSEFRNPHYHQSTDTPDTLDYVFLRRVAQLLAACVLEKAGFRA